MRTQTTMRAVPTHRLSLHAYPPLERWQWQQRWG